MARTKGKAEVLKNAAKLETLDVTYLSPEDIQPNDYNPNRQSEHDFSLLLASMSEDGFTQPVVVIPSPADAPRPYTIVDGEHRWRAGQELGYKEIPVVITPMTPEQAKIATLRHNRARGSEDVELTAQLLRDLRELGALDWAQDSLQMDDAELTLLLDDIAAPDALASEEYGEAWNPISGTNVPVKAHGGGDTDNTSAGATERLREREARIAVARTEEEKEQIRKDTALYRVHLTFSGEEGAIVKRALGDNGAAVLIEMCRQRLGEAA